MSEYTVHFHWLIFGYVYSVYDLILKMEENPFALQVLAQAGMGLLNNYLTIVWTSCGLSENERKENIFCELAIIKMSLTCDP